MCRERVREVPDIWKRRDSGMVHSCDFESLLQTAQVFGRPSRRKRQKTSVAVLPRSTARVLFAAERLARRPRTRSCSPNQPVDAPLDPTHQPTLAAETLQATHLTRFTVETSCRSGQDERFEGRHSHRSKTENHKLSQIRIQPPSLELKSC
ncbi:hypothetical protein H4Q26_001610 [Puccinia striiformis f. sp. tritici PST-130]|uniref:Uncharacterized protein n=2 Tax=Puccinia striiformis TaxID=27350 RepID=A0A2S4VAP0_9BASI|nr:hypothetical protein H4Q26_001610 [Puccinia striiformis f. sp. tritici PST-130]KNE92632.1 hypothetical protein PSTG_13956 [Puccinia striiformis f. sp. tritici PST-78]POW02782.1 hypothetical protein PSTT_11559 [Puccinia striiformis]POW06596.1 hypothetical protein PSTT_08843 [Puccinia striiformis]